MRLQKGLAQVRIAMNMPSGADNHPELLVSAWPWGIMAPCFFGIGFVGKIFTAKHMFVVSCKKKKTQNQSDDMLYLVAHPTNRKWLSSPQL